MDGTTTDLNEKLDQLLREAAEVPVALDRVEGTIVGSLITRLSRVEPTNWANN
jgi:hypothetical protein